MKTFGSTLLVLAAVLLANGCQRDTALIEQQKSLIVNQEKMITDLKSTMDEQGEVIVEQIAMMAEMQATIDKQRTLMKETTTTLRDCAERL